MVKPLPKLSSHLLRKQLLSPLRLQLLLLEQPMRLLMLMLRPVHKEKQVQKPKLMLHRAKEWSSLALRLLPSASRANRWRG